MGENISKTEIKALIDKYGLIKIDDKIRACKSNRHNKEQIRDEVAPYKAEILKYLEEKDKARSEEWERKEQIFNSIPGVAEISEARLQFEEWKRRFDYMVEHGTGRMENVEHLTPAQMDALEAKYPMAVFALEARWRAYNTSNYELHAIWQKTYEAICNGEDIEIVKAKHEEKEREFVNRHLWD